MKRCPQRWARVPQFSPIRGSPSADARGWPDRARELRCPVHRCSQEAKQPTHRLRRPQAEILVSQTHVVVAQILRTGFSSATVADSPERELRRYQIVAPPRLRPEQPITVCLQQEVVVGHGHVPPVPNQMDKPESRKNRRIEGNHPHVPRVLPPPLAFSLIRPSMATDGTEKRRSRRRNGLIIEIWERQEHLEPLVEERPHRQGVLGPLVDAAPHPPPDRPSERRDNPSAAPAECPDHERSVTR